MSRWAGSAARDRMVRSPGQSSGRVPQRDAITVVDQHATQRAPDGRAGTDGRARLRPRFPLVEAKLSPPTLRPGTVPRERLIRMLAAEPRPSVVSIIAPPGYGKTVLLAEWATRDDRPVAWLALDELDNVPSVFLTYVAAAIDRIAPIDGAIRSALILPGSRILATAVPRLAAELFALGRPAVLVLDDVHCLTDRTCLDALAALLDHLPPGFQVAMAARTEPDLPFARLRAERDLLEIRRDDLALDEDETGALTAAAGRSLARGEIRLLRDRTEGWAASIYLATLAREGADGGTASLADVSGRDGYIAEYLRSELRPDLDEDDVTFLTRTSILEVVERHVAEATTGMGGADGRLRSLARTNQLIAEVAGSPGSYRYHRLLRDYLGAELERREPGSTPALHRRAAAWYVAAGRADLAVEQLMRSGDVDAAADVVLVAALPTFYGGHGDTLDRWLQQFDDAVFMDRPPLAVIAAWIHILNGRPDAADRMADIAERATFTGVPGDGAATFESQRAMLRVIMARGGLHEMVADAMLAAATEPPTGIWRANALWLLGATHRLKGDTATADAVFADAAASAASAGTTGMIALAERANVAMARGDWAAAESFSREADTILDRAHFGEILPSLLVHVVAARVAIHRGDLARGREELVRAQLVRPLASHVAPWVSVGALLDLARAYLAVSDPAGARNVVREAEEIARRRPTLGVLADELVEMRRRLGEASRTLAGSSTLTGAELRLLPILSTHLTFQEIGDRFGLSRHTVKTQAISIYGKLQASSRGEAIERAIEIGLLEPFPGLPLSREMSPR